MEYVVIAIVASAAVYYVSYPLFGRPRRLYDVEAALEFGGAAEFEHLRLRKARIEENVRELEFEHQMGKLSEEDYAALSGGYTNEMDEVTKLLEALAAKRQVEDLIENEVRGRRRIK
jgi:hypothetical protein